MIESFLVLIEPNTGLMELKGLKIGAGTFFDIGSVFNELNGSNRKERGEWNHNRISASKERERGYGEIGRRYGLD